MYRLRNKIKNTKFPLSFTIKIDGFPEKKKINIHSSITFITGTLFIISETMPFTNTEYNGIIHTLSKIQQEYKSDFK